MTTNAKRATWAEQAVFAFARETNQSSCLGNPEDYLDVVSDLFTDLLHLCDREDLNIELILQRAYHHHDEEVFEEDEDSDSSDYVMPSGGLPYVPATGADAPTATSARRRGRHLTMG